MAKNIKPTQIKTKKHQARQQREARQTRIIMIITIVVGALILGLIGYGLIDQMIVRPRKPVAKVGDTIIRVEEFESQVKYTRVQMLNQTYQYYSFYQQFGEFGQSFLQTAQTLANQLAQPVSLGREVLDQMIDDILIREAAAELGISVSEAEIDEAVREAFGFFPDGTPTPAQTATLLATPTLSETQLALVTPTFTPTVTSLPADPTEDPLSLQEQDPENEVADEDTSLQPGSEDESISVDAEPETTPTPALSPTITLTPTPYTTQVFGENIKEFNNLYGTYDFDIQNLRKIFEVELLREKLVEEIAGDLEPFNEEVWARHILVETEDEAQQVYSELEDGADFHELAATYSIDESNANEGGNLGWFDKNMMVTEFSEAAFNLDIGEISEPVETSFGFHIIQALGKRESQLLPDEYLQEKQSLFTAWLSEQRNARQDIVIYDDWEEYVPNTPEIPQQLLFELLQQ